MKNIATLRSLNAIKYSIQTAVFDRLFHLPESFYREYDAAQYSTEEEAREYFGEEFINEWNNFLQEAGTSSGASVQTEGLQQ